MLPIERLRRGWSLTVAAIVSEQETLLEQRDGAARTEDPRLHRLRALLDLCLERNPFYLKKFRAAGLHATREIRSLEDLRLLPFTTKAELSLDQLHHPPYGTNRTSGHDRFTHIHMTSGTTGAPLRCLDSDESWDWWGRCWETVYHAAGISAADRIFFAFSFGPFIGFWSAFEGARRLGAMSFPGGGMSSLQRVQAILANDITTLICTPSYALHLAETAARNSLNIRDSAVRITLHAGEPGASVPATKARIAKAWGSRCFDHAGASEVGAWGYECSAQAGLHLNESEFIFEVIDPQTNAPAREGELVVTNLGRIGSPVIRYRTGDRVMLSEQACDCGRRHRRLAGGVLGRVDDVLVVRGVNVYPTAIENIVLGFDPVDAFAVDIFRRDELDEMQIRVELRDGAEPGVGTVSAERIRQLLGLRAQVLLERHGTLPRQELKARRFTDHRPRR